MNAIQMEQNDKGVEVIKTDSGEIKLSIQTIKRYLVNGQGNVTDQEAMMFLALCKGQKLNPFMKDAYLIKYGDKQPASMVVSKDVFMKRAVKNPDFDGIESGVIVINAHGEVERKKGAFYLKVQERLVGAWATVHRKSWKYPISVEVNFDEYVGYTQDKKTGDMKPNKQWSSKPATMIIKVAETQALRKAFVEDLQGMYDESEMNVSVENNVVEVVDIPQVKQEVVDVPKQLQQAYKGLIPEPVDGNDIF
ncbi:phage recombination protein Bet [Turicibacter sanguinis]|uniref:phage recombination protein Bet n=1 Tax=Turicibacter sanguinis TaxID=154288 RepID=UPI0018ABF327|nr:phage recombination protein Bet [Turicibacter sanguinis]MDB8554051.1 phage recombination protein Bet [Turicibacter sanguinis]